VRIGDWIGDWAIALSIAELPIRLTTPIAGQPVKSAVQSAIGNRIINLQSHRQSTICDCQFNRQSSVGIRQSIMSLQLDEQLRRYQDLARRASDLRSHL
jgi:hypothetical protein